MDVRSLRAQKNSAISSTAGFVVQNEIENGLNCSISGQLITFVLPHRNLARHNVPH
jgi:hypothetical protein